jgi:hypothetical protein
MQLVRRDSEDADQVDFAGLPVAWLDIACKNQRILNTAQCPLIRPL